jgi:hypothetical protein
MRRDEEIGTTKVNDDELLFRLRHMAKQTDQPTDAVMGALTGALADGTMTGDHAQRLMRTLAAEGVIDSRQLIDSTAGLALHPFVQDTRPGYENCCAYVADDGYFCGWASTDHVTRAPRPGTANHSAEFPRLDQRCPSCGYGINSHGHRVQCKAVSA